MRVRFGDAALAFREMMCGQTERQVHLYAAPATSTTGLEEFCGGCRQRQVDPGRRPHRRFVCHVTTTAEPACLVCGEDRFAAVRERSMESPHRRAIRIAGNLTRAHRHPAPCPVDDEAAGLQEPPHKATALRSDSVWVPFGRAEAGLDRASCLTQVVDAHIYEARLGRRSVPQRQAPSWQKLYLVELRAWVRLGEAKSNAGAHEVPHLDGTR